MAGQAGGKEKERGTWLLAAWDVSGGEMAIPADQDLFYCGGVREEQRSRGTWATRPGKGGRVWTGKGEDISVSNPVSLLGDVVEADIAEFSGNPLEGDDPVGTAWGNIDLKRMGGEEEGEGKGGSDDDGGKDPHSESKQKPIALRARGIFWRRGRRKRSRRRKEKREEGSQMRAARSRSRLRRKMGCRRKK